MRVHIGAAEVLGRVRVLDEHAEISPGEGGLAQLRLEAPVVAVHGDHFIIRAYSPPATIAGGIVVDPFAVKHRGKEIETTRERLRALMSDDRPTKFATLTQLSGDRGVRLTDLVASTGWKPEVLSQVALQAEQKALVIQAEGVFLATQNSDRLCRAVLHELAAHHKREPLARGLLRETLREKVFAHSELEVFRAVLAKLEKDGAVVSEKDTVRAREHSVDLSEQDAQLRDLLQQVFETAALEPPSLEEALARAGVVAARRAYGRKILQLLIDSHVIVRVQGEMFIHVRALEGLKAKLLDYGSHHEPERLIDVATFKDLAGVSRKYAIPLLEHFDLERVTRRAGDKRVILR